MKPLLVSIAGVLVVVATLASCAVLHKAGDKATAVAGGAAAGSLLWFLHPLGLAGAALAAAGGALFALLLGGGDTVINEAPTSPWTAVVLLVAAVLLARSWAHWLPPLLEIVKRTAKGAPRALLGGKPASEKPKFPRLTD